MIEKEAMNPIKIRDYTLNEGQLCVMAGPCAIESYEQFHSTVQFLKKEGVTIVRGGIYKPRTSPESFQGLREKGFSIVKEVKQKEDFIFITEGHSLRTNRAFV